MRKVSQECDQFRVRSLRTLRYDLGKQAQHGNVLQRHNRPCEGRHSQYEPEQNQSSEHARGLSMRYRGGTTSTLAQGRSVPEVTREVSRWCHYTRKSGTSCIQQSKI